MSRETSEQVGSEPSDQVTSEPPGEEGADIRRRLYLFTAVLVLVFLVVIALGFLL